MTWGGQVTAQIVSIAFTAVFAIVATTIILYVLRAILGDLRVSDEDETTGIDLSEHSESAYSE